MALLQVENISKSFGGIDAVVDLSFHVQEHEIVGFIGPNGAGKTTVFNLLAGFYKVDKGRVFFAGENVTEWKAHLIARYGLVRTFQSTEYLFFGHTVLENLRMAKRTFFTTGILSSLLGLPKGRREEIACREEVLALLKFLGLSGYEGTLVDNLPHGLQRILGVGIGLAAKPKLLLLDEPMTGMNPNEKSDMSRIIRKIRDNGTAIVLIEHDMRSVMDICDNVVVINFGCKLFEGKPEEVTANQDVIDAYLGKKDEHY